MREQPPLAGMHPVLAEWFARTFGEPTDVQRRAWDAVSSGDHTLIAAPTGSGKTLAALLPCLNALARGVMDGGEGIDVKGVKIVYITPLKALNNDIYDHAIGFMEQVERLAAETEQSWPGIRSAVRTGDTKPSQRAAMLRNPPDLLVTTPESLYLLLTSEKGRQMLRTVRQVIVDEIHDLAGDKRGAHLSLTLERLADWCGPVQRIGVSATQKPLERVARYLGGWEESPVAEGGGRTLDLADGAKGFEHPLGYQPRSVRIVESDMVKPYSVQATMPDLSRPLSSRDAVWLPLLDRLLELMEGSRSVLIYVNSRRLCERLCLRLNDHVGYEMARAHHGSMSREWRLEVERMLKSGELRCIVATASLELGIDVGHVDFVIQIDPPPEAAAGIQRVGRGGHAVGDTSRGAIVARYKGVLPDIAVLSRMIEARDIEEIQIPRDALDVLSQQSIAMAAEHDRTVDDLYRLVLRSDSYRGLPRERLDSVLELQSGFYPFVRPLLDWDRETGTLSRRSNTAMAAISGAGTIPSSSAFPVHHAESRALLGELDEEFIQETKVGDVFQLGSQPWMVREIRHDRVYATEAGNRYSEIPFWRNEAIGRSFELGSRIGVFLRGLEEQLDDRRDDDIARWLVSEYRMDSFTAGQLIDYIRSQKAVSLVPTDRRIVIEHYRDVANQKHVVIHNHFGKKVNRTWLLAIERQFEGMLPYRIHGNAKDNGIELVFSEWDVSWLHTIWQVTAANAEALLAEALAGSPLLAVAFRRISETSLLLARSFTRTPLWQKRLRGAELLKNALPYADRFPYFHEAMRECMHDYLDIDRLLEVLEAMADGRIETVVRETDHPSPMAAQFIFDYVNMRIYEGDGLDESVQVQLLQLSKSYAGHLFGPETGLQAVDPDVLAEENRRLHEVDRTVQNADELLRLMKMRGDLSEGEIVRLCGAEAAVWLGELQSRRRAAEFRPGGGGAVRWIPADEREVYDSFPQANESVAFVIGRYADNRLSFSEQELRERYPVLGAESVAAAVERLIGTGMIEQAPFDADAEERIWSSAKVASRLIRLSIVKARKSIEPVDPARWLGHLLQRQHVLSAGDRRGTEGLLAVIARLQGLFLPLSHWESIVLPARLSDYRKDELDLLCASGEVVWLGRKDGDDKEGKVAFFLADNRPLYEPWLNAEPAQGTQHPELLALLRIGGARFLTRLSQETGRAPSDLLPDLLDLVWEGHVSNDQFAPLRLSIRSRGKDGFAKVGSGQGRWYWTGSLIEGDKPSAAVTAGEGDAAPEEPPIVRWVHHLLQTYGILTKELAAATSPYAWDMLIPVLRKLEEWGAVTRGMFIRDLHVLQFTTRELAEAIRKPSPLVDMSSVTLLSSVDPANPYGKIVDWPQVGGAGLSRKPGNYLVLQGDRWLIWMENNGKRIYAVDPHDDEAAAMTPDNLRQSLKSAFLQLLKRQGLGKVTVEQWNGEAVLQSPAEEVLRSLGAERDKDRLVLWPSQLR